MESIKERVKKLDKWDFRALDQLINEKIRSDKAHRQYKKFNQDAKNRSLMIKGYKKVFGIDVVPSTKGII